MTSSQDQLREAVAAELDARGYRPRRGPLGAAEWHADLAASEAARRAARSPAEKAADPTPAELAATEAAERRAAQAQLALNDYRRARNKNVDGLVFITSDAEDERLRAEAEAALVALNELRASVAAAGARRRVEAEAKR